VIQRLNRRIIAFQARNLSFIILVLISLILSACNPDAPVIPAPTELTPYSTALPVATQTLSTEEPVQTQTPTIPIPQMLLLAPEGSDPSLLAELQPILADLATQEGYALEIRTTLTPEQIGNDVQVVVSLPPDPGLESLAASANSTRFLAIGMPNLGQVSNLSSVSLQATQPEWQGFMAGVIAALVTPDWRVGVISISDTTEGIAARAGFMNGVVYFCGTCRQIFPPFFDSENQLIQYPLFVELPAGAAENEWISAADILISRGVETVYVYPGAGGQGLLGYLAEADVRLVGGIQPAESLSKNWVASISPDPNYSLYKLIQKALQGQEIPKNTTALQINHVNSDLFSPGRQKLAESILADLLAGYIEAGNVEGEQEQP
jgi:basic membrane lipoprotein Med (substrate-binding protein (PBP1-ABC) superfamily)